MLQRLSAVIGAPSGILLLMFFFLPWVTLSCEAGTGSVDLVSASGLELATGDAIDELESNLSEDASSTTSDFFGEVVPFADDSSIPLEPTTDDSFTTDASLSVDDIETEEEFSVFEADSRLWLIPIAGLLTVVVAGLSFSGMLPSIAAGGAYILASVFAFAIYILKYMDFQDFADELDQATVLTGGTTSFVLTFEAGFYFTVAALFGIFSAGCVAILFDDLMQQPKTPTRTPIPDLTLFETTSTEPPNTPSWMNK